LRTFVFGSSDLVRVHLRTETTFRAGDPWNGEATTDWNLDAFRWFPESLGARGSVWSGYDVCALRSEIDGVVRMLPETLTALWREGRIPAASLPRLLRQEEPSLRRVDYAHFLHRRWPAWIVPLLIATALLFLALRAAPPYGGLHALLWLATGLSLVLLAIVVLLTPLLLWRKGTRRRRMAEIEAREGTLGR
jgi:hypothetical protein